MADQKTDRRSQRTRRMLHAALMALVQEKRYDDITVQDVLDRADVGRSTFYAHFQDKEDLMTSGIMHLMQVFSEMASAGGSGLRLIPAQELFEHVQQNHNLFGGMVHGRGLEVFFEKGHKYWVRTLITDLQARLPEGRQPVIPAAVLAQFITGTFVVLLHWWLDHQMPNTPAEMDAMFQQLVQPAVQNWLQVEKPA